VRIFKEEANLHHVNKAWDREQLSSWIQINNQRFTAQHIKRLLKDRNQSRTEALYDAIFEVYNSIDWTESISFPKSQDRNYNSRRITAGIFRDQDEIAGTIKYLLYPRMPRYGQEHNLKLIKEGKSYALVQERTGWFSPLWAENIEGGVSYKIDGNSQVKELCVPRRDFWILVADQDNNNPNIMASWSKPRPFEHFILLCHKKHLQELNFLKQLGLMEWDNKLILKNQNSNWVEFQQCIIKSFDWRKVPKDRSQLFEELRPSTSVLILLRGGLRVSHGVGWLEHYPPEIAIQTPEPKLRILIRNLAKINNSVLDEVVNSNSYFAFPGHLEGEYLVQVYKEKMMIASQKFVKIISWESLTCQPPNTNYVTRVGELTLQGALVKGNH